MAENTHIIDNKNPENSSANFESVVKKQIKKAKINGPFIWTIKFECYDYDHPNMKHTPLKVEVPIKSSFDGLTPEETEKEIMFYIRSEIRTAYNKFKDKASPDSKSPTLKYFRELDISKDLDLDLKVEKAMDDYVDKFGHYIDETKEFIDYNKEHKKQVLNGEIALGKNKKPVYFQREFITNKENDDATKSFGSLMALKIDDANRRKQTTMYVLDFIRTDSIKSSIVNTQIQTIVPILPTNAEMDSQEYFDFRENQIKVLTEMIKDQALNQLDAVYRSQNPKDNSKKQSNIEFLERLDLFKDIDFGDNEEVIKKAKQQIQENDQQFI